MALKAGYRGIKKYIADKLNRMNPGDTFATDAEVANVAKNSYGLGYVNMVDIPANSDLNDYKTPGSFISKTGANTNSFSNCPVIGSGINLHVESTAGGTGQYIIQTLKRSYSNVPEIWKRAYNGTAWGDWVREVADESLKADVSALGTQEGATASRLYHPGEHFYKDGQSCEVIGSADVAQGATWTLNTNYKVKSVYDSLMKKGAFSGTTNNVGIIRISDDFLKVIFAEDTTGKLILPFVFEGHTFIKVINWSTMDAVINTAITGTYYYID